MAARKRIRVVLYATPDLILRYASLASRFDLPRSEVYRVALDRGYKSTVSWLERTRSSSAAGEAVAAAVALDGDSISSPSDLEGSPLVALQRYADKLLAREEVTSADQFRLILLAHADVVGINSKDAVSYVDAILDDVHPTGSDDPGQQRLPGGDPVRVDLD